MPTTVSHDGTNSGFQAGIINGNVGNITIAQSETLDQACLRDLRITNPDDDRKRITKANGGLLEESYRWILDKEEFKQWRDSQRDRLLWIRGDPGKGKTMLLCGIIDELRRVYGSAANISFFFCQATDARINNATAVLRGLIYLLVENRPSLLSHVRARYDKAGKSIFEDTNAWIALSAIFTDILKDPSLNIAYLIIDALDECTNDLCSLLDLIVQESSAHPHIKWIVSSRNLAEIINRLDVQSEIALISLELNEASVSEAVNNFIQHKVDSLTKAKRYKVDTRERICRHLLLNSQGTFLWVALVCQNLDRAPARHAIKKLEAFPPGLDDLYSRMMDQVRQSEDADFCKQILGIMSTVYRPITLSELNSLVKVPDDEYDDYDDYEALSEIIAVCGSFLALREDTIIFVHQSAKDFLLREALNDILPRGAKAEHHVVFLRSLEVMFKTLRRDIFDIDLPGFSIEDMKKPMPNPLAAAEYACVYWVDHLQGSERNDSYDLSLKERGCVDAFIQQKYLHWLEALSLLRSVSDGVQAMRRLEVLIQEKANSQAIILRVQDASMFIRYFRTAIESSPLQVYYSPFIFSPTGSITRHCFQNAKPDWILNNPLVEENWSPCLDTLEGHTSSVDSIAWSPDGNRIASASRDKTTGVWEIRIWDLTTSQSVCTLKGHSGRINSIAWSPHGSQIASASDDKTVRIWDSIAGQSVSTLQGHTYGIKSVAWSPDGSQIASASDDKTVRIWDPIAGQSLSTLQGHTHSVISIHWSPDGSRLASVSNRSDVTVRIWDPATSQILSTYKRDINRLYSIAWSPDGSRLALASDRSDTTVTIWDPITSQSLSSLKGHTNIVTSIAWSLDGSQIASASSDTTVRVWDPITSQSLFSLKGHTDGVTSIAWSPDGSRLASSSSDTTVKIWDPTTNRAVSTLEGHSDVVVSVAWSPDKSRCASGSSDRTVRIWDPATGRSMLTLEGHTSIISSIAWSPDGSQLATASFDRIVIIWNSTTGRSVLALGGHTGEINSIAWSPDGGRLASASNDNTVRIWDLAIGQSLFALKVHESGVISISWSPDGSQLASGSEDKTVRIWDPTTGRTVSTLHIPLSDFLQFDKFKPDHLHTIMGSLDIGSIVSGTHTPSDSILSPELYGYGLSQDSSWVTYNGVNMLWLPSEYRPYFPSLFAISGTNLAIGCSSGHVIFLALTERHHNISR